MSVLSLLLIDCFSCSFVRPDFSLDQLKEEADLRFKCGRMNKAAGKTEFALRDQGIVNIFTGQVVERWIISNGTSTTNQAEGSTNGNQPATNIFSRSDGNSIFASPPKTPVFKPWVHHSGSQTAAQKFVSQFFSKTCVEEWRKRKRRVES